MKQRERFTPIPLPAEKPVAQLIIHLQRSCTLFHQPRNHSGFGIAGFEAIEHAGIYSKATLGVRRLQVVDTAFRFCKPCRGRFHHHLDRQVKLTGKGEVAFIVGRNSHDGACAVTRQNIIGNPYRHQLAIGGISRHSAGPYSRFYFRHFRAFKVALARCLLTVRLNRELLGFRG